MKERISIWIFSIILGINSSYAQDIQLSQFYAVPIFQNPAFAGSAHATRVTVENRIQWPRINSSTSSGALSRYTTSYASIDTYSSKYRSGFAMQMLGDWQAGSTLTSTQIGLQYAYELPISKTFTFRPGLQLDYVSRSIDYSKLRFPEDYNNQTGWNGTIQPGGPKKSFADVSSGVLLYSEKLWGGFSVHHMNTPNQSLTGGNSSLPANFTLSGGYKIHLNSNNHVTYLENPKEITLTPTFNYKSQGKSDQTDVGVYFMYDQLMAGAWYRGIPFKKYPGYRNNESIVVLLGWKYETLSIGYSYDFTVSKLQTIRSGGSHELNITYIYAKSKKYKPMKRLPCPQFYGK